MVARSGTENNNGEGGPACGNDDDVRASRYLRERCPLCFGATLDRQRDGM